MATKKATPPSKEKKKAPKKEAPKKASSSKKLRPHIIVRVGRIPGKIEDIALNGDRNVETALNAAGIDAGDGEIRVNDRVASLSTAVKKGDHILVGEDIEGNQ